MDNIKFEEMYSALIVKFPELTNKYEEVLAYWDGEEPGQHNVYEDVLNPYIDSLLDTEENKEQLIKVFDFLECLLLSEDERVQEVVVVTVLEHIDSPKYVLERARKYMGENTLHSSHEVEKAFWRDPSNRK